MGPQKLGEVKSKHHSGLVVTELQSSSLRLAVPKNFFLEVDRYVVFFFHLAQASTASQNQGTA